MASPSTHLNVLPEGHKLHWYTISRVLGRGGFGITYLAHDDNLNTEVAIKEFLPSTLALRAGDETVQPLSDSHADTYKWGLQRFVEEARTLAKFRHPNIVLVHSVFEANNTAYIVMEYQNGQNLEAAYREGRLTSEEELKTMLRALVDGVEVVHQAGFVHRDIKPANIYLKEHDVPVLLDFGSARQALGMETQTLTAMVSPGYAPFEQYNASRDQDNQGPWTDIYAIGCTIYRGIAGKSHADALMLARDRLEGKEQTESPATSAGSGRFDPQFLAGIDQSMRFKPEQRPQSIAEWRDVLGFSPAAAYTPPTIPAEPTDPVSQDDIATLVTGPTEVAAALNIPAAVSETASSAPAQPKPAPAVAANVLAGGDGKRSMPWAVIGVAAAAIIGGLFFAFSGSDNAKPVTDSGAVKAPAQPEAPKAAGPTLDAAAINKLLASTKCGAASATLSDTRATITGSVDQSSAARITSEIAKLGTVDDAGLKTYPDTYCNIVNTFSSHWNDASSESLSLTTSKPNNALAQGDRLVLEITADSFDANHLYVDYFTLDGSVVHLLSETSEQTNVYTKGQSTLLGEEGDIERWDIAPPFGQELITVIATSAPLFTSRSSTDPEGSDEYAAKLTKQIKALTAAGESVAAQRVLITTSAN